MMLQFLAWNLSCELMDLVLMHYLCDMISLSLSQFIKSCLLYIKVVSERQFGVLASCDVNMSKHQSFVICNNGALMDAELLSCRFHL